MYVLFSLLHGIQLRDPYLRYSTCCFDIKTSIMPFCERLFFWIAPSFSSLFSGIIQLESILKSVNLLFISIWWCRPEWLSSLILHLIRLFASEFLISEPHKSAQHGHRSSMKFVLRNRHVVIVPFMWSFWYWAAKQIETINRKLIHWLNRNI